MSEETKWKTSPSPATQSVFIQSENPGAEQKPSNCVKCLEFVSYIRRTSNENQKNKE